MENTEEREPPNVITSDTNNATKVQPKDAPPHKKSKFRRFRSYNRGTWNGPKRENKEVIRRQDDLHRFDSLASSLNLTDYQKDRGRNIFDDLDFQQLGTPIDHIIFAVCIVVANADVKGGSRYWPHSNTKGNDEQFAAVAGSLDLSYRQQLSILQKVKARTDY